MSILKTQHSSWEKTLHFGSLLPTNFSDFSTSKYNAVIHNAGTLTKVILRWINFPIYSSSYSGIITVLFVNASDLSKIKKRLQRK